MYETDDIARTLIHTQDNETVKVDVDKNKLHILETSKGGKGKKTVLEIYVPKRQKDQDLCFLQLLPIRLFNQVLMDEDSINSTRTSNWEAVRIIAAVLESNCESICALLAEAGIIPVLYDDAIEIDTDDKARSADKLPAAENEYLQCSKPSKSEAFRRDGQAPSPEAVVHPNRSDASDEVHSASKPPATDDDHLQSRKPTRSNASQRKGPLSPEAVVHPDRSTAVSPKSLLSPLPRLFRPFRVESGETEYRQLLDNVIAVAQGKGGMLPSQGPYNFDALRDALPREVVPEEDIYSYPYHSPLGFQSDKQSHHNKKLGAAGELYVGSIPKIVCNVY